MAAKSRYVECPECDGAGTVDQYDRDLGEVVEVPCPECCGDGKILQEDLPEEQ